MEEVQEVHFELRYVGYFGYVLEYLEVLVVLAVLDFEPRCHFISCTIRREYDFSPPA